MTSESDKRSGEIRDPSPSGNHAPEQRDPDRHGESSTARATAAAIPEPRVRTEPLPELGELDDEFYLLKRIAGAGEVPEQTHKDSAPEVIRMAENNGYIATGDVRVAEARSLGDAWDVYYCVPVRVNDGPTTPEDQKRSQEH